MSDWASVNGVRLVSGSVCVPYRGLWEGDVVLATTTVLPPVTALTLGDLTMVCAVLNPVTFGGQTSCRLIAGTAGWRKAIAARAYQNPGGVPLSVVLGDAASDCGELVSAAALSAAKSTVLGQFAVREAGPAAKTVLRQWCEPLWWADWSGALQLGSRSTTPASGLVADVDHLGPIASRFDVERLFEGQARFRVASDAASDWMPGRTFSNANVPVPQTISSVTHLLADSGWHRLDVLVSDS